MFWERRSKALIRATVLLNLRLLVLPRVNVWRHTRESVRCTILRPLVLNFRMRQRKAHSTALISRLLMCSLEPFQVQPHTVLQTHRFEGMLALRRWYRSVSSLGAEMRISSPLILTRFKSFLTNWSSFPATKCFLGPPMGGLVREEAKSTVAPGEVRSMACWTLRHGMRPNGWQSCPNNQVTTVTFQLLPRRVSLKSWCAVVPCSLFGREATVKCLGNPRITSRSSTFTRREAPPFWTWKHVWYWYGGNRKRSSCHHCLSVGLSLSIPAGRRPG